MTVDRLVSWMASLVDPIPPVEPASQVAGPLRGAGTVLDGDAVLAGVARPDWAELAAEHRREPFGRVQRRVLVARRDCPDELTRALLTPWDPLVAARLVARRQPVPQWTLAPALARIGELRPSLLRHALSAATVDALIHGTPRLDLLVRAVDGYDHNHHRLVRTFWEAAGRALHRHAGDDHTTWLARAAALPTYRGSLAHLLRRPVAPTPAAEADLRMLAQAPNQVLAEVVAALPDATLDTMHRRDLYRLRGREWVTAMVLDRLVAAGVPARPLFARWTYWSVASPAIRAWAHGLDPWLDRANLIAAETDADLRRRLAADLRRQPAGCDPVADSDADLHRRPAEGDPVADLPAALAASPDPVHAEALLQRVASVPWDRLLDAPLPVHAACALAARADVPEAFARTLPAKRLDLVAGQSPGAARAAVTALDRSGNPFGVLHRVRAAAVLDDRELLAVARPARHVLQFAHAAPDGFVDLLTESLTAAHRPAGFWPALRRLLPEFDGTVPAVLAAASA
jgi:hypothetical protein